MKTISFVIPVYNEEKRIEKTIKALQKGFYFDGVKLEKVIFVDDGSNDNTKTKIKDQRSKLEKTLKAKIKIISYKKNKGKGFAIRTGLSLSNSDYTLFFDVDMSVPLIEFKKFLPFIKEKADVVIGTRKNGQSTIIKHQPLYRELLGRGFTLLSNIILNVWVTDFTCGFKMFSKRAKDKIIKHAFINGWSYDSELLFLAKTNGFRINEVAVKWSDDKRSKVNLFKALPTSLYELILIRYYNFLHLINKLPLNNLAKTSQSYSYK